MDHTEGCIAVLDRVHDDPHGKNIVNLIQRLVLVRHLFIDTEEMLDPAFHLALDLGVCHVIFYFTDNVIDESLPGIFCQGNLFLKVFVRLRFQVFERQIVKLNLDPGNTKSVGKGRVDLDGFPGLFLLFFRLHILKRPHVVKTVSQFN